MWFSDHTKIGFRQKCLSCGKVLTFLLSFCFLFCFFLSFSPHFVGWVLAFIPTHSHIVLNCLSGCLRLAHSFTQSKIDFFVLLYFSHIFIDFVKKIQFFIDTSGFRTNVTGCRFESQLKESICLYSFSLTCLNLWASICERPKTAYWHFAQW